MIFENKQNGEKLELLEKGNYNVWICVIHEGDDDDIREDYIFTDAIHGYELVAIKVADKIFEVCS